MAMNQAVRTLRRIGGRFARTVVSRMLGRRMHPSWSVAQETLVRAMRSDSGQGSEDPVRARRAAEQLALPSLLRRKVDIEKRTEGGVPGRWFAPKEPAGPLPVLLWFHGGGYVIGSSRTHADLAIRLALAGHCRVFVPDYRRGPEDPYPAAVEDADAVYEALLGQVDADRIVVGGDSAGGALALVVCAHAREADRDMPAGAVLLSPWVDLTATGGSLIHNEKYDWITLRGIEVWGEAYLAGADPSNPDISPIYANLRELPPLFVEAGECELFIDQVREFVGKLRDQRVAHEYHEWDCMVHDGYFLAPFLKQSRDRFEGIGRFVKQRVG